MKLNVYKIIKKTKTEGPGIRFCIWVQGCSKHCDGCYAKETWSFVPNQLIAIDDIFKMIQAEKEIEGVTFLGGEPFEQAEVLGQLAYKVRNIGLSVVTFTGMLYENLQKSEDKNVLNLLKYTDLLIDGGFEKDKIDFARPWVGSSNQRYVFLSGKYNEKMILSFKNKIEVRVNKDGTIFANGMGDFKKLQKNLGLIRYFRSCDDV